MKVKVLRGADIDGQAILVSTEKKNILIDAGMDMKKGKPLPLDDVANIDYLFVTHAHLDHSGEIPEVLRKFRCQFICNEETEKLIEVLFQDRMYAANRKNLIIPKSEGYINVAGGRYDLNDFILHTYRAGHIAGASSFMIEAIEAGGKKLMVSGDISMHNLPTVEGADFPSQPRPDVLFLESTYGDKIFPSRQEEERRFVDQVEEALIRGGNVLIPGFAVGRTPDIAKMLNDNGIIPYIDGMGRKIADALGIELRQVTDHKHREKILCGRGNVVVVPAGFLKGGFAVQYLKRWAGQKNNAIFFPSPYQTDTAKEITDGKKSVIVKNRRFSKKNQRWIEEKISVSINAEVDKFSLSGHSDQSGLVQYAAAAAPKKIFLIHGEAAAKIALAEKLRAELKIEIVIAQDGDEYEI